MPRILLVDDDHDILDLGNALLTDAGYDVVIADNVQTALQLLRSGKFDLMITDANMPSLTGFDLIRTVKRDSQNRDLAIVMLTGRREKPDIVKAIELGVQDYILKPLDPMLFVDKIVALMERERNAA